MKMIFESKDLYKTLYRRVELSFSHEGHLKMQLTGEMH